jgi:hypothetical protein
MVARARTRQSPGIYEGVACRDRAEELKSAFLGPPRVVRQRADTRPTTAQSLDLKKYFTSCLSIILPECRICTFPPDPRCKPRGQPKQIFPGCDDQIPFCCCKSCRAWHLGCLGEGLRTPPLICSPSSLRGWILRRAPSRR